MATGLEEIEGYLADPISLQECGGDRLRYADNVLRWALRLAMAAQRAPGFIRAGEHPHLGSDSKTVDHQKEAGDGDD